MSVTEQRTELVAAIGEWVDREVVPVASELEHADEFPADLVAQMRELGLFGVTIPERYGGLGLGLDVYALIVLELSRGWTTLSGIVNGSFIASWMIRHHGTDDQKERLLPLIASGEVRASFSMTEPHAGSDVQSIRTTATRDGDDYVLSGQKMWVTNGWRSGIVMLLAKTDPAADPPHAGMTGFVIEKEPEVSELPGLTIPMPGMKKLGYKGVESTELIFDGFRTPADSVLGGDAGVGQGFKYFMSGIEVGRVNVAARGAGIAKAALDDSLRYAQQREAFGKPIAHHQAVQLMLAKMATRAEAARLLVVQAAERKAGGERADLEAGMAKYFATEAAQENALDAMRIHGGYGYSPEFRPERYYRDAPLLLDRRGLERDPAARDRAPPPRAPSRVVVDFAIPDELTEIRAGVRELCERFPGEYWRELEPDRYPEEFVAALTRDGWLAALIPEEYGGAGLSLTAASVILEEINATGGNAGACHAQMYTMGTILRHGSRRAEGALPAEDRERRAAPAGLRRHRAHRRLRHDLDPDDGRARERRLRDPRPEDLDVAGAPLRPDAAARAHDAPGRCLEERQRACRPSSST